jgi:hypothetical protein
VSEGGLELDRLSQDVTNDESGARAGRAWRRGISASL